MAYIHLFSKQRKIFCQFRTDDERRSSQLDLVEVDYCLTIMSYDSFVYYLIFHIVLLAFLQVGCSIIH